VGVLRVLVGYRNDQHLPPPRRAAVRAALAIGLVLVIVVARLAFGDGRPGSVQVVRSLDDHVRRHAADAENAIPSFIQLPGALGIVTAGVLPTAPGTAQATSTAGVIVKPLSETELAKGFCAARLSHLIRHEYPGSYDDVSDAELERLVLEKHPSYRDKLCVLPAWIDATPLEIVKYAAPSSAGAALEPQGWVRAAIAATVFLFVALNLYYRLLVVQLAPAASDSATTHS
jgi:hypothetical protein